MSAGASQIPLFVAIAVGLAWSGHARADEGEVPADEETTIVKIQPARPRPELRPWRGLEARYGRELTWSRWMLADAPALDGEPMHRGAQWLNVADLRADGLQGRPHAGSSAVSAIGSVAIAGLPMVGVRRNGKMTQRHFLRAYFRTRGVSLVWRIEF
jgi:hypothetical protein